MTRQNQSRKGPEKAKPAVSKGNVKAGLKRTCTEDPASNGVTDPPPKKRNRKTKNTVAADKREGDNVVTAQAGADKSKTDGLAQRSARNAHPGLIDRPRARRTPAQVKADEAQQAKAAAEAEAVEAKKRDGLALLMAKADAAAQIAEKNTIRHHAQVLQGTEDDASADSVDEVILDLSKQKATKQKKSKERGTLRDVVDARTKELQSKKSKTGATQNIRHIASGLKANWNQFSDEAKTQEIHPTDIQGGLNDEELLEAEDLGDRSMDMSALLPDEMEVLGLTRDQTRKNELVGVPSKPRAKPANTPLMQKINRLGSTLLKAKQAAAAVKSKSTMHANATTRGKKIKSVIATSHEDGSECDSDEYVAPDDGAITAKVITLKHLPKWAQNGWSTRFLRTLYNSINASESPFEDFASGSEKFLNILIQLIKHCYPAVSVNTYTVEKNDPIYLLANKRINEYRSKIIGDSQQAVRTFFEGPEFGIQGSRNTKAIMRFCDHALRPSGPGWYKVPTPFECTAVRGQQGYIEPCGFLESTFVVSVASKFLRLAQSPEYDFGPPKGLFALIMAGLERGFRAHIKTGYFVEPPRYTAKKYKDALQKYLANTKNLSERRWDSILSACGFEANDSDGADISLLEQYRDQIYVPSSPEKA